MSRRSFPSAALFGLATLACVASAFAADLSNAWSSWRYSRPISLPAGAAPVKLSVPLGIYSHLDEGFAELRVVDDLGKETPFLLYDHNIRAPIETRPARIRENSFVPGQYTQLVIELGAKPAFHNALEIETSATDFINWVEVAASDDARTWRIVKDRAPISNFRKENVVGSRMVRYSDNNARFLRVRIFESAHQFPVSLVDVSFSREFRQEPVRAPAPSPFAPDPSAPANVTRWIADLGPDAVPVSGVAIETSQPEFFRVVHMQTSDDGKDWQDFFSGEVYRYTESGKEATALRVCSHEGWHYRFWRIEVVNGNDAPLAEVKPTLLTIPYFVLFYPQTGRAYRLLYGNAAAKLPSYDLARTFDYQAEPGAPVATLGPEQLTANYRDPRPYSERHPVLLWIALAIAVALLAYTALRTLRAPKPAAQ
jgi:hypothetical protein